MEEGRVRDRQGRERDGGRESERETGERKRWRKEGSERDREEKEMEGGRCRVRQERDGRRKR